RKRLIEWLLVPRPRVALAQQVVEWVKTRRKTNEVSFEEWIENDRMHKAAVRNCERRRCAQIR
ncbi:MAG: hypothetical protein QME59_04450, partial [Candidatus Hydrothermarchaeota archaeon]|nr:hypothetical protein [Candidatus Hydrothermarchaeota archaeon]